MTLYATGAVIATASGAVLAAAVSAVGGFGGAGSFASSLAFTALVLAGSGKRLAAVEHVGGEDTLSRLPLHVLSGLNGEVVAVSAHGEHDSLSDEERGLTRPEKLNQATR